MSHEGGTHPGIVSRAMFDGVERENARLRAAVRDLAEAATRLHRDHAQATPMIVCTHPLCRAYRNHAHTITRCQEKTRSQLRRIAHQKGEEQPEFDKEER